MARSRRVHPRAAALGVAPPGRWHFKPKIVNTNVGQLDLRIPQTREYRDENGRTTNSLEQLNGGINRRLRVATLFP